MYEDKRKVISHLTHDIRTALGTVIGYSEIIREDIEEGQMKVESSIERLEKVANSGKEALKLLGELLETIKED